MASSFIGKHQLIVDPTSLATSDQVASYLVSAAGSLITSTTIGGKNLIDALSPSDHLSTSAYTAGTDYLNAAGVLNSAGNYVPLQLNAAGELPVSATVDTAGDYAEDSAATSGDVGIFTLLVRQDTLAASTSADGDYGAFKSNNLGELYVHDTSALAQLVSANSSLSTIVTNTGSTATNTSSSAATLTALSKAEDAAHSSGDQGIQLLAVRKDAQSTSVSADGDYASIQAWSEGSIKVVDVANGAILQQQVTAAATATALPASALANRKNLMIQNPTLFPVWIGSSTVTTSGATTGIYLPGGATLELDAGPAVAVYAIRGGAAVALNILESA